MEKNSSTSMHTRNLRFLAAELLKSVKGPALTIINDLISLKETKNHNLRQKPRNETVRNGFESISYLGPNIS